ncbi:DoxX family protein [Nocardia sp. NBC_01730]|uniref:DoxX family protein n=1 Tax=Nocardia sp. NBC_01730 TaxID=2975998 RepID=UPI002E1178DA|nr:DoxX family protein [Nocardia sp. NBC_01730]
MTAVAAVAPTADRSGKVLNRTLWTLQIVLCLFFIIASGLPKVFGQADAVRIFNEIGLGDWFRYLTGIVEIAGGIGLLVPRLSGLAAAGLSVTMVLAAATQAFIMGAPGLAPFPLVLAVLFAWLAYRRRDGIVVLREMLSR